MQQLRHAEARTATRPFAGASSAASRCRSSWPAPGRRRRRSRSSRTSTGRPSDDRLHAVPLGPGAHTRGGASGVVPIGAPYPGRRRSDRGRASSGRSSPGQTASCWSTGPQVTPGYWRDPEKTAAAFVVPPGREETHYRTGDRVRRPVGDAPIVYLGRDGPPDQDRRSPGRARGGRRRAARRLRAWARRSRSAGRAPPQAPRASSGSSSRRASTSPRPAR